MHNYTNFVPFLEKSLAPFFENSGKNLIFGPFFTVFGQNDENDVKYQKSAWIGFLVLNVAYFMPSFRKIGVTVSEKLP